MFVNRVKLDLKPARFAALHFDTSLVTYLLFNNDI